MSTRADIVTQLGSITGITPYESEPATKHPGASWPALRGNAASGGVLCGWRRPRIYDVFTVLPNAASADTANRAEELIEEFVEALEPLGELSGGEFAAEVVQIRFDDTSTVPGLRVRLTILNEGNAA